MEELLRKIVGMVYTGIIPGLQLLESQLQKMQARQQDPKGPVLPTKSGNAPEKKFGNAPEKSLEMHQKNPSKCGTLKLSLSTHPNLKGHTSGDPLPHKGAKVVIPTTAHFSKRGGSLVPKWKNYTVAKSAMLCLWWNTLEGKLSF